jgi:hypothetical protein
MEPPPQTFDQRRHVIVPSLVTDPLLAFLWRYIIERAGSGRLQDDEQVRGKRSVYADPVMEHLLERVRPAIETATDLRLFPTYSYARVYEHGDALARHADRPSCEISVSVNLGQEAPAPWPLWIAGPAGDTAVHLRPGDALVYRGIECEHWREAFEGARLAQVFLHYVDAAGPHREWRFDKRDSLALTLRLPI